MLGLKCARQSHVMQLHMQGSSRGSITESCGFSLLFPTFVSAKNVVILLAQSFCVMTWTTLLCMVIPTPLTC